jgi:acyl-CoA reductase-like NAD-dependent aldehyde dehydrogenase
MSQTEFTMTIAGEAVPTGRTFGVRNPATGEVFAEAPECSHEQLDAAFDAAAKAARDWKADEAARRDALRRAADVLLASPGDLAPTLTAEQGKPLADAGSRSSRRRSGRSTSPTSRRRPR